MITATVTITYTRRGDRTLRTWTESVPTSGSNLQRDVDIAVLAFEEDYDAHVVRIDVSV